MISRKAISQRGGLWFAPSPAEQAEEARVAKEEEIKKKAKHRRLEGRAGRKYDPRFVAAARDADLVLGSRYRDGIRVINWPLRRLMLSMTAAKYVQVITGMPITDPTGGYKCFRRKALQSIDLDAVRSNGYSFQIEMTHKLWRNGMRIAEVPIVFTDRFQGSSKMSSKIVREALWMVWRLWFQSGLRRKPRSCVKRKDGDN